MINEAITYYCHVCKGKTASPIAYIKTQDGVWHGFCSNSCVEIYKEGLEFTEKRRYAINHNAAMLIYKALQTIAPKLAVVDKAMVDSNPDGVLEIYASLREVMNDTTSEISGVMHFGSDPMQSHFYTPEEKRIDEIDAKLNARISTNMFENKKKLQEEKDQLQKWIAENKKEKQF